MKKENYSVMQRGLREDIALANLNKRRKEL
jgi:hypothetical protein